MLLQRETVGQIPVMFLVGDTVDVLNASWIGRREIVMGSGIIERITYQSSDGTPLYWVSGFPCARTARVLRLVQRAR